MTQLYGFGPVADEHSRVLVLGSMPGVASLEKHQYYGHPRNAFWQIMGELFAAGLELDYQQRLRLLLAKNVGLWDVLMSCRRPGSLDSDIQPGTEQANDFSALIGRESKIRAVFFNGKTAEKLFMKHVAANTEYIVNQCELVGLPSTSPAHAAMSYANKLKAWSQILDYLD